MFIASVLNMVSLHNLLSITFQAPKLRVDYGVTHLSTGVYHVLVCLLALFNTCLANCYNYILHPGHSLGSM